LESFHQLRYEELQINKSVTMSHDTKNG
jgi:hypothetical protein